MTSCKPARLCTHSELTHTHTHFICTCTCVFRVVGGGFQGRLVQGCSGRDSGWWLSPEEGYGPGGLSLDRGLIIMMMRDGSRAREKRWSESDQRLDTFKRLHPFTVGGRREHCIRLPCSHSDFCSPGGGRGGRGGASPPTGLIAPDTPAGAVSSGGVTRQGDVLTNLQSLVDCQ